MNFYFDGNIENNLIDPDTSITVFKKKEEGWEKLLDPYYSPESKDIPKIEEQRKSVTLCLALNKQIDGKICKVTNVENGTVNGPKKVGNFKWDIEVNSNYETWKDPNHTVFNIEVNDA
jgi:hypothetical protein